MGKNNGMNALRLIVLAATFFVVICCAQASFAYTPGDPEFRAFWVDAWHGGVQNQAQVNALLGVVGDPNSGGTVRDTGCNAVFVQVRRDCNTNYPSGMGEPYMSGLSPADFNGLQAAINAAHDTTGGKKRIEVHAWMVTFRTSGGQVYGQHDDPPTGSLTNLDNYWPSRDNNGNVVADKGFDPGHPLAEDYTVNVAMDLVNNFDIDGIHFDYIRFTANNQGYNPTSIARYNARYGTTGQPAPGNEQFKQWRRDQVSAVVRKVYALTQASKPNVKVSGSFVTWNPSPTSSTRNGFKGTRPYYDVFCDWDSWLQEGIVDAAVPMTYYNWNSLPLDYNNWMNFEKDRHGNRHMYIGPGLYMNSLSNSILELQKTRDASPAGNHADGFAGFSYFAPYTFGGTNYGSWSSFTPSFVSQVTGGTWAPIPDMPWKSHPTKGHICGTVTVRTTGRWADGATVTVDGPEKRTATCDGTGFYAFVDLTPGVYVVTASMPGLPSSSRTVDVEVGVVRGNMYITNFILGGPVISSIQAAQLTTTSESITWQTDVVSNSQVQYGLTTSYGSTTTLDSNMVNSHAVVLSGLTPKTVYHYRVISGNADGTSVSDDQTFTSLGPPEISGVNTSALTNASATIAWNTDQGATTQVEYGLTSSYGSATVLNSNLVTSHTALIAGIPPLTTYHYRVISGNPNGTATSGDYTFTTSGAVQISSASVAVSNITSSTATVTWTTNAPSDSTVSYGPTISYGSSATSSTYVTSHSITLTGLTSSTPYHFRCSSSNTYGPTSTTGDFTFTTLVAPVVSNVQISGITASSATVTWTTDQVTDSTVSYGYVANTYLLQKNNPTMGTSHSVTLTGISSATTYHIQAVSSNATGIGRSADFTFDTPASSDDIIVDDTDTGCSRSGTWSSGYGGYKKDKVNPNNNKYLYVYNAQTSQSKTCTWTPTITRPGNYDVYVYYPSITGTPGASIAAPYTVRGNGGDITCNLDQTANTYQWVLVASKVPFVAGTAGFVRVGNKTGEALNSTYVLADAAKFIFVGITGPPAISNVASTVTATSATIKWNTDQNSGSRVDYGPTTSYGSNVSDTASVSSHSITLTGLAPNTTYHYRVYSSNTNGSSTSDDYAIRTPAVTVIVDDADTACTTTGAWTIGSFNPSTAYNSTYRFAGVTAGDPTATATFTPNIPVAGAYDVYCYYNSGGNRSADASYTITTTGGDWTEIIDQTSTGSQWVLLASDVQLAAGSAGKVVLDNSATSGSVVIADAIKWTTAGVEIDSDAPTMSISAPSVSGTKAGPVSYTVTYDDNVLVSSIALTANKVMLNTTGTANGNVTITGAGTTTRTVTISNITGSGTIGISLAPGTATDSSGNIAAGSDASATFVADNTPPDIAIGAPSSSLTSTGPVAYTVTYNTATAVNLTAADITLQQVGTANGTIAVSGTGNYSRTVTISNITGDGELGIQIGPGTATDVYGNVSVASDPSMTFSVDNTTIPTAAISGPSAATTSGDPITYTISYDSAADVSLCEDDITLNKTGTADGTVTVTGEGTAQRTVTISNFSGTGTLGISLAAGTATAATGTPALAAGPSATFTVSGGSTTVSLGVPSATMTSAGPVSYTITYGNPGTITLSNADVTLNNTGTANGIVSVSGSDPTTRTVTISGITGNGTLGISIAAGTAGASAPAAGPSTTFTVDNTAPVMGSVTDDTYTTSTTSLSGAWSATDSDSGVTRYEYAVGTDRVTALNDIKNWTDAGTATSAGISGLSLTIGQTYYVSVRATNGVGVTSAPMSSSGVAVCFPAASVLTAKGFQDNKPVALPATLIVSAAFPTCFYIEDDNRLAGIRVQYSGSLSADMSATVMGILGVTIDGERAILSPKVIPGSVGTAIKPVALVTKSIGGSAFGFNPGITGGIGLNNTGLLVKIAGKVTAVVSDGFYLDDGAKLTDGTGNTGIKVWTGAANSATQDSWITVTGVVSLRKSGTTLYPQILKRSDGNAPPPPPM